jgi:hypothetical protein
MAEDLRYVFAHVQQNYTDASLDIPGSESTQMVAPGTPIPTYKRPGTGPVPTISRTPSSGVTPLPRTQMPFTLPSQARMQLAEKTEIGAPPAGTPPPRATSTYILPQTQQTSVQPQVPAGDLPPISPTPVPSPSRVWWIVASSGFLGIAVLIAILWSTIFHPTPVPQPKPKPPIDKPIPQVPVAESGWVSINIQPWAQLQEVRDAKGIKVPTALSTTPCRLELPPGKYTLVLKNPALGSQSFIVEVRGSQTTIVNEKFKGFDYAKAVDSLGL